MKAIAYITKSLAAMMAAASLAACGSQAERQERAAIEERQELFPRANWGIFDTDMSDDEKESMRFLYAYMPASDYADYTGQFFLDNTRAALRTRTETAWGKDVPDSLFRHFVLPVRVNNEELDSFRTAYQDELLARVKGMSIEEAALEVNHWCHEHVTYAPSDSRTSAPLATLRTALGRCGEQSVFAVAAMRAAGIPARQVYTPRWAHTDDNHAWIEVWTGDRWHFMGACEPEAVLDLAWFNGPAARAMLMHTQVMGPYEMADDIIKQDRCYTEINVISNYVKTRRNTVRVVDGEGRGVPGAKVEFKIYNYAELSTVATLYADDDGTVKLTTGLGDMVAWASDGGSFGYALMHSDTTTVELNHTDGDIFADSLDITPPADGHIDTPVTEEQTAQNKVRLAREDSIRHAYTDTFVSEEAALKLGLQPDAARLVAASQGNHKEIMAFLGAYPGQLGIDILQTLSQKDLRDVPSATLASYYDRASKTPLNLPDDVRKSLIAPRVENEPLRPFAAPTDGSCGLPRPEAAKANPELVAKWVTDSIMDASDFNPRNLRISPDGVWKLRASDAKSKRIFLVALCRALGVPARLNSVTGRAEYYIYNEDDGEWTLHTFSADATAMTIDVQQTTDKGTFTLLRPDTLQKGDLPDLVYYRHLSLAYIEEGVCQMLNFESGDATELGAEATWQNTFSRPYSTDAGYYMLTTGTRLASGKVLARLQTFTVEPGQDAEVPLLMRHDSEALSVVASIDAEAKFSPAAPTAGKSVAARGGGETTILATTGRGYFILAMLGSHDEPSNHATHLLQDASAKLNEWGRPVVALFSSETEAAAFDPARLSQLKNTSYGIDTGGRIMKMLSDALPIDHTPRLPLIVIADTFGRVVYYSEGYNTSLETQLTAALSQL